ncbi:MAG: tetratricopeptide repeat protein [Halothiobacillus sp.]
MQPGNIAAKHMLATVHAQTGEFDHAAALGQQLLKQQPADRTLKQQVAYFLFHAGQIDEAIQLNEELLVSEPNNPDTLGNITAAHIALGQFNEAESFAIRAALAAPLAGIHDFRLGLIRLAQRAYAQAEELFRRALAKTTNTPFPDARNGLGMALFRQGKRQEARDVYADLLQQSPGFVAALPQYGLVLYELGDFDRALQILPQAIAIQPNDLPLRLSLARVLNDRGRYTEAQVLLMNVLDSHEIPADAHALLGAIELALRHYPEALIHFEQALAQDPNHIEARIGYLSTTRHICAFTQFDRELARFLPDFRANPAIPVAPFLFISFPGTTAEDQLEAANRQAQTLLHTLVAQPPLAETASPEPHGKIRVGFLTNDFRQHATGYLMVEMLENLDHTAFEWHAYSWGAVKEADTLRPRIEAALDHFHDISTLSDHAAAQLIKDQQIDILIDLKGITQNCRPLITARHPAKIQINWLGFPGSIGQGIADYLIGDPVTCPPGSEHQFAETVLRMPYCYLPSPLKPQVARRKARAHYGLPETGTVFGCFNQSYKISSDVFTLWCQILDAVPGSVLWLLNDNPDANANLKAAAATRGVDPDRLVFADYIPHADNLARLAHMDVMLDTFYYNGHTTTSDALSQGVPVITKIGTTFPSRVAASLLQASKQESLICTSNEEYLYKAVDLAQESEKLTKLRASIKRSRQKMPLFDNIQFARDFETLLLTTFSSHPSTRQATNA